MPGEFMPPEPVPAGNDGPAQEPETAGPPQPSLPVDSVPEAPSAGAGQSADIADPARTVGATAPTDQGAGAPLSPPGAPLDPAAITGPPWPRLVAADGAYTPPRLARWPIVVGILLFAGWIAALVAVPAAVSSSSSGYVLTARDAHFTATFPARPHRAARTAGTATIIAYTATLPDHAVGVTAIALPASAPFSLDGGINGFAASLPGAKIVSRHSLTYLGQPAEDATISSSAGLAQVRVVRFGSSAYVLQAFGPSASSYAHDYNILLDSFRLLTP